MDVVQKYSPSNKTFDDLPIEILIKILCDCISNCGIPRICIDRLSLVCQKWFQITQYHVWQKENFIFCLSKTNIENDTEFIFKNNFRIFYNLKIKCLDLTEKRVLKNIYKFVKLHNAEQIESLIFLNCTINFKILCKIIKYFNNLRELHIEECIFDSKEKFPLDKQEINNISDIMSQLKIFHIRFNNSYNSKIFYQFALLTYNIESFSYEEKYIAIIKDRTRLSDYKDILCTIARNNFNTLNSLDISPIFDETELCFKESTLNLKTVSLKGITSSANISSILKRNKYLENLNISFIFDFASPDINIDSVLQEGKYLKSLKLEFSIVEIRIHKYIRFPSHYKYFFRNLNNMSKCDSLVSLTILNGRKFVDFNFYNHISENVRNLESLIIRNEILIDEALQAIFKNLNKLKVLVLDDCCFSDYAFSGYNVQNKARDGYSINHLSNLEVLTLGSKNLNNILLIQNIIFPNLKRLEVRDQKNLSLETIVSFIQNCPRLKILQLSMELNTEVINCYDDLIKLKKTIAYDKGFGKIDYCYRIKYH